MRDTFTKQKQRERSKISLGDLGLLNSAIRTAVENYLRNDSIQSKIRFVHLIDGGFGQFDLLLWLSCLDSFFSIESWEGSKEGVASKDGDVAVL